MKQRLIEILRCPSCLAPLELRDARGEQGDVDSGTLQCTRCPRRYAVVRGVPRFVPDDGYASSFGFQWNEFRRTQLDSYSGAPISRRRFIAETGWDTLDGALVLDGGCGAGRFAEVALDLGAEVMAIDYSSAVDAAWQNLGAHPRMHVVQADIYRLPFAPGTFDKTYSLGVLQHTPDVRAALAALVRMVRPGGEIAADFYLKRWTRIAEPKHLLRPLTRRMRHDRLFRLVRRLAPPLLRVSNAAGRVPIAGRFLRRLVPVANYSGVLPLDEQRLRDWAILDTFDWLSPRYDQPQTIPTVRRWMEEAGLETIDVRKIGHLTCRGRVPARA